MDKLRLFGQFSSSFFLLSLMYTYGSCSASLNFTNCKNNDNNQPLVKYQSIKRGVKKPDLLGSVPIQCTSGASDEALA